MLYRIISPSYIGYIRLQGNCVQNTSHAFVSFLGKPIWQVRIICFRRGWRLTRIEEEAA